MREICFDTETTGLDPKNGDKLIEIGCVEIIDRKITGNTYRQLINPGKANSQESIEITGITDDMLKDKPFFNEMAQVFLEFIGDSKLIAHNATFDINFINYELQEIGLEPLKNEVIDSLVLAKLKFPGKKNNLDVLCERFNVDKTAREKNGHGALLDAQLLADVYLKLTEEEQGNFFNDNTNKKDNTSLSFEDFLNSIKNNKKLEARNFKPTQEELDNHKAFIEAKVKNNLWYPKEESVEDKK